MTPVTIELAMAGSSLHATACAAAATAYQRDLGLQPLSHPKRYVIALIDGEIRCVAGFHLANEMPRLFIDLLAGDRVETHRFLRDHGTSYAQRRDWAEITCVGALDGQGRRLVRSVLGETFAALAAYGRLATLNILTQALVAPLDKNQAARTELCGVDQTLLPVASNPEWWGAFITNYLEPSGRKPTCTGISVPQAARAFAAIRSQIPGRFDITLGDELQRLHASSRAVAA